MTTPDPLRAALDTMVDEVREATRTLGDAYSNDMPDAESRLQATESARQQTEVVRAGMFARDLGGKQTDYLEDVPMARLKAVGE